MASDVWLQMCGFRCVASDAWLQMRGFRCVASDVWLQMCAPEAMHITYIKEPCGLLL